MVVVGGGDDGDDEEVGGGTEEEEKDEKKKKKKDNSVRLYRGPTHVQRMSSKTPVFHCFERSNAKVKSLHLKWTSFIIHVIVTRTVHF